MSLSLSPSHSDNDDDEDEDGDATSSHDITLNLENEHDGISNTHHSSLEAEASHVSGMPHHRKQVQALSTYAILQLAYQSIGVVYGDVGTSPLYVFASTFPDGLHPTRYRTEILGSLSLIIYTLTLIPLVKYICVVLWANDNGDGGTFALYSLICRSANVSLLPNQQIEDRDLSFYKLKLPSRQLKRAMKLKNALEKSHGAKTGLLFMALLGTCMVIGDGVLTPAISVLSAVSGIQAAISNLHQDVVVIVSILILIGLFSMQRFGTSKVGIVFAPVVLTWFISIGSIGLFNIFKYDPTIFKAFNPMCIYDYFQGNLRKGWISLGGIVLCITGVEAMFADLGHFSVPSIQIAFGFVVYPCCLLAYLGQAAYLMKSPEDVTNTFYRSIPEPLYWPIFAVAIAAAVIASQAMVSATFSIVKQSMDLSCFPTVKVVHTSSKVVGQVYVPEVNWVLMIAAIVVTAAFQSTNKLGNAYGIAVVGVMIVTTSFITLIMIMIWQTPLPAILAFLTVFGFIDMVYFSSVLFKFVQGGYLPLAFSVGLLFIMYTWHYGATWRHNYELQHQVSESDVQDLVRWTARIDGISLLYTELASGIPCIFSHSVKNLPALHAVVVFVCVKFLPVTTVMDKERFLFCRVGERDIHMFRCVARYGYKEVRQDSDHFELELLQNLEEFITQEAEESRGGQSKMFRTNTEIVVDNASHDTITTSLHGMGHASHILMQESMEEIAFLRRCKAAGVVYLLGNSEVKAREGASNVKKVVVDYVYDTLRRNCRRPSVALIIPHERLLEVGMVYDV